MTDPERWLGSADAPSGMKDMLTAAQKVGPTTMQRAALAGKLGIATSGLWLAPVLKTLAVGAVVAGGTWAVSSGALSGDRAPVADRALQSESVPHDSNLEAREESPDVEEPVVETAQTESPAVDETARPEPVDAGQARVKTRAAVNKPSEASLLRQARQSLDSSPRQALAALDRHSKLYPQGVLTEEREVLRIRALESLGRAEDAKAEQRKFHEKHPDSVHHVP